MSQTLVRAGEVLVRIEASDEGVDTDHAAGLGAGAGAPHHRQYSLGGGEEKTTNLYRYTP